MIDNPIIKTLLYPLSLLFGMGVYFRNLLFDHKILESKTYNIPTITVGNLSVGGTGKTPHIEYLVNLLKPHYRIAVVSRGYRRKSKGLQVSSPDSTPQQLGDEPFQIFQKNQDIIVVADSNRRRAIEYLKNLPSPPQVVLLDDCYQHRYVKAGLSILLTDYNYPFYSDCLMPAGRLREPRQNKKRADIIIVSKTPLSISKEEKAEIAKRIKPLKNQEVFFSSLHNPECRGVMSNKILKANKDISVLLVTGIAKPQPIEEKIKDSFHLEESLHFRDHADFSDNEIEDIKNKFDRIANKDKAIIVTEKDAVKLRNHTLLDDKIKDCIYFLPLEIVFLRSEEKILNKQILDYVAENQTNS